MPARVLIVEDDAMSNDILATLVRQRGHITRSLFRGDALTEVAALFQPDIVLLDIRLPGMNGLEAARRLRERFAPDVLPIVGVSGLGSDADKSAATSAGFTAYFTKPIDYPALLAMVDDRVPALDSARAGPRGMEPERALVATSGG